MTATQTLILVIDNNQAIQEECIRIARRARERSDPLHKNTWLQVRDHIWTQEEAAKFKTEDGIRDLIEREVEFVNFALHDIRPKFREDIRSIAAGMLQSAINDVNWAEVGRHYIAKLEEQEKS
jgi:hypothetical protein